MSEALSIHVDVRRRAQQHGGDFYGYVVEASTDGAGFATQYVCALQEGETMENCRRRAEDLARVFVNGCRYAGAQVRATSGGYGL